jgi:hypothetical protein
LVFEGFLPSILCGPKLLACLFHDPGGMHGDHGTFVHRLAVACLRPRVRTPPPGELANIKLQNGQCINVSSF